MKTTLCAIAALLMLAASTGCQTCGPTGGILAGGCTSCGDLCGGACTSGNCGCGDACGDLCGAACRGGCGPGGRIAGHMPFNGRFAGRGAMGNGVGPLGAGGGAVAGALAGLHGPSAGAPRISGNFDWRGHRAAHHAPVAAAEPGPATAAYSYPYYTTRGPRDFLLANPPPLGR